MIFWCIWEWFLSVKNVFLIWFSLKCLSLKFRVLRVKEHVVRTRDNDVFIESEKKVGWNDNFVPTLRTNSVGNSANRACWTKGAEMHLTLVAIRRPDFAATVRINPSQHSSMFEHTETWPNDIETFHMIYRWKGMEVYFLLQFMEWHFDVCRKIYGQLSDQWSDSDHSCDALF